MRESSSNTPCWMRGLYDSCPENSTEMNTRFEGKAGVRGRATGWDCRALVSIAHERAPAQASERYSDVECG